MATLPCVIKIKTILVQLQLKQFNYRSVLLMFDRLLIKDLLLGHH